MDTNNRKIGILGGTFNPIHLGHLMIAEVARETFGLEHVIFVPAKEPPHKDQKLVISAAHRYAMAAIAVASNPYFSISDVEMKREGKSYSVDTVRHFRKLYGPDVTFYFIAGTDTIQALPTWHYVCELLEECYFIGAIRPNATAEVDHVIASFGQLGRDKIKLMDVPEMKLSATYLRERLKAGKTVRYMLPAAVVDYINTNEIYR